MSLMRLLRTAAVATVAVAGLLVIPSSAALAACHGLADDHTGTNGNNLMNQENPGNGVYSGLGGDDAITSNWGDDTVCAGSGSDWVHGDGHWDGFSSTYHVALGGGNDWLLGDEGCDRIQGGDLSDTVGGGSGHDTTPSYGGCLVPYAPGIGNDGFVDGGGGNDNVNGGDAADMIFGSGGTDSGNGGLGTDRCHSSLESVTSCENIFG
jgi:Ca2+-binding RTX toxin-like protein